jgi:hypothetical protein
VADRPTAVRRAVTVALMAAGPVVASALAAACTDGRGNTAATHRTDTLTGPGRWVRDSEPVMRHVVRAGQFTDRALSEASGIVPVQAAPGHFWGLNDSGNDERLFAFDSTGKALGTVRVRGATNVDWEALTSGPCPEGQCLFIADVGDNSARRPTRIIWRVPQPAISARTTAPAVPLTLRYADGPHDIEAVYAAPDSSLWLVTKRPTRSASGEPRPSRVYRIPAAAWAAAGTITVPVADSVPVTPMRGTSHDWITDASLSAVQPDGRRRLVLLSYGAVHVLDADPATGRPGALLARCALPISERNAEGVTWLPDGRILLVNEGRGGGLYTGRCP